jgi:F-type H+-transporting ATPase subunit a
LVKIEDREKAIAEHIIPLGSGGAAHSADTHAAGDKSKDAKAGDHKEEAHHAFVPVFRGGNADLNSTLALAIIAQVLVHVMGVKTAGIKHHLAHFKNPIEIVTEISKVLSFGFRLFGNVFAGEVLLTVMGGLLAILTRNYFLPFGVLGGLIAVPFLALEFFVGAIQGLVFAMLVIGFLSVFVKTDQSPAHH